ncbi:MAG TPA: LuxR C-terminal-related transcriptional regulator [Candidatus Rubrimentiphilum sp.]|nr:LuxR C-terminal-related transcriptional regulator [Candidatus Rubrimentiphilum sp.]
MQNLPARARVSEQLARAARFPVTLVAAPAGFGKSVALREFVSLSRPDAVIFNVQREHGTLLAFVRALSQALSAVAPSALAAFPSLQERILAAKQPVRELSDWFVAHLKDVRATIVIDDLHFAAADISSIALLADVIERTSDRIHWILAARSDVGLPVATWIAYGRMDLPIGEDTLRLTSDEALVVSREVGEPIDPLEVETLRRLTDGWPLALHIALRTRTRAKDLPSAAAGARDIVYRYLAEQIFSGLSDEQREFLLASSIFASFDASIARALGGDPQFLMDLKRNVTFLSETSDGVYRYHDLFRDFLEMELRRRGPTKWIAALRAGALLLQEHGDEAGALRLYARATDTAALTQIIERSGIAVFERGESESLRIAIDALPHDSQRLHAAVLGIRAMLEAARGHFDLAEPAFVAAIEGARETPLRLNLVHRYAVELVRHGRDAVALLEPYAQDRSMPRAFLVPILGTLATAYVRNEQLAIAHSTIERALRSAGADVSDDARARLYQQAAYVYQFSDAAQARKHAELAIELAVSRNLFDVAARACSVLFAISYNELADPAALLAFLDRLGEYARKGGSDQTKLYGLIASYDLHVERGDETALDELDRLLLESHAALPLASNEMLLPARALRAAWHGNFARAFTLLQDTPAQQRDNERRALAASQVALYGFLSGMHDAGDAALREAALAIEQTASSAMPAIRAQLFLALAELVRGHGALAHKHLLIAEQAARQSAPRLKTFADAVRVLARIQLGQAEASSLAQALENMRSAQFGGIARMIAALPIAPESKEAYGSLTAAERNVLELLATGASTKEIAANTGRSPQTVDTHIRSICRKLGCSGRREAVALATGQGWVQPRTPGVTEP